MIFCPEKGAFTHSMVDCEQVAVSLICHLQHPHAIAKHTNAGVLLLAIAVVAAHLAPWGAHCLCTMTHISGSNKLSFSGWDRILRIEASTERRSNFLNNKTSANDSAPSLAHHSRSEFMGGIHASGQTIPTAL